MEQQEVLEFGRYAVITLLSLSLPLLMISLGVGLAISLLQTLTQIQEMTITFVPKIIVIFISIFLLMPYMAGKLSAFMDFVANAIINIG
ncbi:MAG: flagellar biosynthesis protein FliQ [Alphaproteobacteria bacterium]|nr:flagellar biosynthesis protein FliQ [Alphaproteobacteria bacterium]MCH9853339.1 flagellar biosynthesis protein FliQ [Alphaproteobacteria bacterium]